MAGVLSFFLGTGLSQVQLSDAWAQLAWRAGADAASTLVQVVAASVITVTTLTFSLTVLALQLASQQFSPRLLREFTRDPVTRWVLSILVATFAIAMAVLRQLHADSPIPQLAVLAVMIGGLASLVALLGFITHIVRVLRVDTMMATVHQEAQSAIKAFYPAHDDNRPRDPDLATTPPGAGHVISAATSGFVRLVDVDALVTGARRLDVFVQLIVRPGDHVVDGTPMGVAWQRTGGVPADEEAVDRLVQDCVELGYERTVEQDSAFGFRQLRTSRSRRSHRESTTRSPRRTPSATWPTWWSSCSAAGWEPPSTGTTRVRRVRWCLTGTSPTTWTWPAGRYADTGAWSPPCWSLCCVCCVTPPRPAGR